MSLDYNNLPFLLTINEVAEVFRCSVSTVRKLMRERPGWLVPSSQAHSRKMLFPRDAVLRAAGLPAWPEPVAAPQTMTLEEAAKARAREAAARRSEAYFRERAQLTERLKTNPPSWRAMKLCLHSKKVRCESDDGDQTFRIHMFFQKNYRPDGWPVRLDLPLADPGAVVRLDTDEQMTAVQADVDKVLADFQPWWDAKIEALRRARAEKRKAAIQP